MALPEEKEQGGSAGVIHFAVVWIFVLNVFHRIDSFFFRLFRGTNGSAGFSQHIDDKVVRGYPDIHMPFFHAKSPNYDDLL